MNDFDPIDERLGDALRRRAGSLTTPTAIAHDAVLRRAGTIRRRRAAIGGGGAMAVLVIGAIAVLPRGGDEIGPLDSGDRLPTVTEATTTEPELDDSSDAAAPTTVDLTVPAVMTPTSVETSVPSSVPSTASVPASSSTPPASSTPRVAPTPSTDAKPPTSSTTPTAPASSTSSAPSTDAVVTTTTPSDSTVDSSAPDPTLAPFTKSYQAPGGSITVSWNGSTLTLQTVSPAAGFVAQVEETAATRLRVRFVGDSESRIEVRVDGGVERVVVE